MLSPEKAMLSGSILLRKINAIKMNNLQKTLFGKTLQEKENSCFSYVLAKNIERFCLSWVLAGQGYIPFRKLEDIHVGNME